MNSIGLFSDKRWDCQNFNFDNVIYLEKLKQLFWWTKKWKKKESFVIVFGDFKFQDGSRFPLGASRMISGKFGECELLPK